VGECKLMCTCILNIRVLLYYNAIFILYGKQNNKKCMV
jgi:hypothetical protein